MNSMALSHSQFSLKLSTVCKKKKIGHAKAVMWTRQRNMEPKPRLAVGGGVSSVELELCCDSHEVCFSR